MSSKDPSGYWRANLKLLSFLLVLWAFVSFGCGILFRETLDAYSLGGYKLGFWFAQQGSIYAFLLIIIIYIIGMSIIDRSYGVNEE